MNLYYISEGSVSHINGVRPSFLEITAVSRKVSHAHDTWACKHVHCAPL